MKDKCYICHETEEILRKTCINTRCRAKTADSVNPIS